MEGECGCGCFCCPRCSRFTAHFLSSSSLSKQTIGSMPSINQLDTLQLQRPALELGSVSLAALALQLEKITRKKCSQFFKFNLAHIQIIISPKLLEAFKKKLEEINKNKKIYAPTVGFHSTCLRENVSSIASAGILGAGDATPQGKIIPQLCGAIYGRGIYISPEFEKAHCYGFQDSLGYMQIFCSIVLPGRVNFLKKCSIDKDIQNDFDSNISPDLREYILRSTEQILPVLLITYTSKYNLPNAKLISMFEENTENKKKIIFDQKIRKEEDVLEMNLTKQRKKNLFTSTKSKKESVLTPTTLFFDLIPGTKDKWVLPLSSLFPRLRELPSFKELNWKTQLRVIYLLDKSKSMGRGFGQLLLPACALLHRALGPEAAAAIFFGRSLETKRVESATFFESDSLYSTPLEDATNLVGAYQAAVEFALSDQLRIRRQFEDDSLSKSEMKPNQQDVLFLFVLMSDGKDTISDDRETGKILKECSLKIKGSDMKAIFSIVGIGRSSDTELAMKLKLATEINTGSSYSNPFAPPVYYCKKIQELPAVVGNLGTDLKGILTRPGISITVREDVVFRGFVNSLVDISPRNTINVRIKPKQETCLLFQGLPPQSIYVGTPCSFLKFNVLLSDQFESTNAVLELIRTLVVDVKVAAVAGVNVDRALSALEVMVSGLKSHVASSLGESFSHRGQLPPKERIRLTKKSKELINELEFLLNDLRDSVKIATSEMTSEQQASWLAQVSRMKYGAKALRRVDDLPTFDAVLKDLRTNADRFFGDIRITSADPVSRLSGLTAQEHLHEIWLQFHANYNPQASNLLELLYAYGCVGVAINLQRSESSNINPWNIIVSYVSTDRINTDSALSCLEAGVPYHESVEQNVNSKEETKDKKPKEAADVLILLDPRNPKPYLNFIRTQLHRAYLAVVFTRNPDLQIPSQHAALLSVALSCAVEQLLTDPDWRNRSIISSTEGRSSLAGIQIVFQLIFTIRRLQHYCCPSSYRQELLKKLKCSQPGRFMTEAEEDQVASITKILVPLVCFNEFRSLFNNISSSSSSHQLREVALALLAEAVSRSARVQIRTHENKVNAALRSSSSNLRSSNSALRNSSGGKIRTVPSHRALIQKALAIDPEKVDVDEKEYLKQGFVSAARDSSYDRVVAKKISNIFFRKKWTNSSPASVVACLRLAQLLHNYDNEQLLSDPVRNAGDDDLDSVVSDPLALSLYDPDKAESLFRYVQEGFNGVTMKWFLQQFAPECDSNLLQIGLYVQGLRYHSSKTRKQGLPSLSDPDKSIKDIAREEREAIVNEKLVEVLRNRHNQSKEEARKVKLASQKIEQYNFLHDYHSGVPKIFDAAEIAELNLDRPLNDRLESDPRTGLLRHHCCFPKCPMFLKDLSTERDRKFGRRNGLFQHLKSSFHPDRIYARSLHLRGVTYLKHHCKTICPKQKESFIKNLLAKLKEENTDKKGKQLLTDENIIYLLESMWNDWVKRGEHQQ